MGSLGKKLFAGFAQRMAETSRDINDVALPIVNMLLIINRVMLTIKSDKI